MGRGGGEDVAVGVFLDVSPVGGGGVGFPCVVLGAGVRWIGFWWWRGGHDCVCVGIKEESLRTAMLRDELDARFDAREICRRTLFDGICAAQQ